MARGNLSKTRIPAAPWPQLVATTPFRNRYAKRIIGPSATARPWDYHPHARRLRPAGRGRIKRAVSSYRSRRTRPAGVGT